MCWWMGSGHSSSSQLTMNASQLRTSDEEEIVPLIKLSLESLINPPGDPLCLPPLQCALFHCSGSSGQLLSIVPVTPGCRMCSSSSEIFMLSENPLLSHFSLGPREEDLIISVFLMGKKGGQSGVVAHTCGLRTCWMEASEIQGHSWLWRTDQDT